MDFPAATDDVLYHEAAHAARGMVSAPHRLAAEAGREVLAEGGNALEAAIAIAAASAVLCPHISHPGGDGVWMIREPSGRVRHIAACGPVGADATIRHYHGLGLGRIPAHGPQAILTVPGMIGGWAMAHQAARAAGGRMSLSRLLERAIHHAREGTPASESLALLLQDIVEPLRSAPGFSETFMCANDSSDERRALKAGEVLRQSRLADTLDHLARAGLRDFYCGDVSREIAADLERMGSPLTRSDLENYQAQASQPLQVRLKEGVLYSAPPPAGGATLLTILALFERLDVKRPESFAHLHGVIEAAKQALLARDSQMQDAASAGGPSSVWPAPETLDRMVALINATRAAPWLQSPSRGFSLWMGAADASGLVVSCAQSLHSAFGSGCILPGTGVLMHNRGTDLSLEPDGAHMLHPGSQPRHMMSPAIAQLKNGRVLACGSTGDDGELQTQSALLSRHMIFAMPLGQSVARPRWRCAPEPDGGEYALQLESGFEDAVLRDLHRSGQPIQVLPAIWSRSMGAAGAVAFQANGMMEGVQDPRAEGSTMGV